mmetsp:Transcript_28731/g.84941  ORF Transcript_28731/g.84941 Transcript_28731/m.84941 type:complete len:918 (-) Transcript_28731:214-2967(-)
MQGEQVRLPQAEGLLGERVVLEEEGVARNLHDGRLRLRERRPQPIADRAEVRRAEAAVIVLGDGGLRLGELELHQVHQAAEEGPGRVRITQLGEPASGDTLRERRAAPKPHGQVEPRLRPGKHPRDRAERLDTAGSLALRGPRAEVHRGQRRRRRGGVKVAREDAVFRLVDLRLKGLGRRVGQLLHQLALRVGGELWRRDRVLEHGDGVALEGVHRELGGGEEGLDLLPLHGYAVRAGNRAGGLRQQRQVEGAASAADGAAAPVEEVDAHAGGAARLQNLLHGDVELPERGELAGVLGRVRVAEHHLVEASDGALVGGDGEEARDDARRILQVLARLEERRDAHRRLDAALDLQQPHREHVGRAARHRDAVGAQALGRQRGEEGEGRQHLLHPLVCRQRACVRDERPRRDQLRREPRNPRLFVPLEVPAEPEGARDCVDRLGVPVALLADVHLGEADAKGAHAAEQVEERAVGEDAVADGDEGAVHELKRREELRLAGQHVRVLLRAAVVAEVHLLHLDPRPVEAAAERHEQDTVWLVLLAPGLEGPREAVPVLVREDLAVHARLARPRDLLDGGAHLRRDGAGVRELIEQLLHLLVVQLRCPRPLQAQHVARRDGRDVWVPVAVSAHPCRHFDDGLVVRHRRLADPAEGAVKAAVVLWHGVPAGLLNHHQSVARLAFRRRLGATHIGGAPRRELLARDCLLELGHLAGGEDGALIVLAEQRHDLLVLLEDRPPLRLGRVRRQHNLDLLLGDCVADLGGGAATCEERVKGHPKGLVPNHRAGGGVLRAARVGAQVCPPRAHGLLGEREVRLAHQLAEQLGGREQRARVHVAGALAHDSQALGRVLREGAHLGEHLGDAGRQPRQPVEHYAAHRTLQRRLLLRPAQRRAGRKVALRLTRAEHVVLAGRICAGLGGDCV